MSDNECLKACGIKKSFGGVEALSECSVVVNFGTVTGFVGSNGAGKSTLFNILSGVYYPSSGSVTFGGTVISGSRPEDLVDKGIVKTFQTPRIFESLSVLENLLVAGRGKSDSSLISAIFGRRQGNLEEEIQDLANENLKLVGLELVSRLPAGKLSGGQKKLLGLARSLMLKPRVLLLDEPLAGVTPSLHNKIGDVVCQLASRGLAVGVVEHHISFVNRVCSQIYALANGEVISSGKPDEVLNHPLVIDSLLK